MLQLEFDREHDLLVSVQEKHHNKNSKSELLYFVGICYILLSVVAISFDKFRSVHPALCEDDDYNDDDIDSGDNEELPKQSPTNTHTNGSGKKRRNKRSAETTPTKHDPYVCGRRNVRNMEKVNINHVRWFIYK